MTTWTTAAAILLAAATASAATTVRAADLPAVGAELAQTSVSGISSGAYMAGQYQIAHAASVVGAAVIAGGPYGCAEARYGTYLLPTVRLTMNASQAINGCMRDQLQIYGVPDAAHLADEAKRLATAGRIDPLHHLARHRVYIFSGGQDTVVAPRMAVLATEVYLRLGVPQGQIKTAHIADAGHAFVTVREGAGACPLSKPPYVVKCGDYDQAYHLLSHIHDLPGARVATQTGDLVTFDQRPFTRDLPDAGLSPEGMVFVPKDCRTKPGCRIHVAFHGCEQNRATVKDAFVTGTGYLNWADANRIVVLFPDAEASRARGNPFGCWDWWGYSGFEFRTRAAPQIVAVHRMVQRLSSSR